MTRILALRLAVAASLMVSLSAFATHVNDRVTAPDDAKAVQGTWKPATAELGGQRMPDAFIKTTTLTLSNGTYVVSVDGALDKGTYALDVRSAPKGMTITGTDGPNVGKTFPSIYELHGDTLRICYDLSGVKRPAEFKTVAGTKLYLVTYARARE